MRPPSICNLFIPHSLLCTILYIYEEPYSTVFFPSFPPSARQAGIGKNWGKTQTGPIQSKLSESLEILNVITAIKVEQLGGMANRPEHQGKYIQIHAD